MIRITNLTQIKTTGFVTDAIDELLSKQNFYQREKVIRPSEIGGCERAIVCDLVGLGVPEVITPKLQRIFDNGTWSHKRWLNSYLPRTGCLARVTQIKNGKSRVTDFVEVSLRDEALWIKGSPDAVIINLKNGLPYIFEFKTIKQETFDQLSDPDFLYKAQLHMYMYLTKIPRGIILYEGKNTQELKEFEINEDVELTAFLLAKVKRIQKWVMDYEAGRDPELPDRCHSSWCSACA